MKYNVWYKTQGGIWVNGAEASSPQVADDIAQDYEKQGKTVRIVPEGNPAPYGES